MSLTRRSFLPALAAGLASAKDRLIIDTHLEVWTLDPKFPFAHPERPNLKVPMAAPITMAETMRRIETPDCRLVSRLPFNWVRPAVIASADPRDNAHSGKMPLCRRAGAR